MNKDYKWTKEREGRRIKKWREARDETIEVAGSGIGIGFRTLEGYENGEHAPGFTNLSRMFSYYKPIPIQITDLFGLNGPTDEISIEYEDISPLKPAQIAQESIKLLSMYEGMSYHCFYLTEERDPLKELFIDNLHFDDNGTLFANAEARGNPYQCVLTCEDDRKHVFFSLKTTGLLNDRVCLFAPYNDRIKGKFNAGVGTLTSLSYTSADERRYPCFQLTAIVSSTFINKIGIETVINIIMSSDILRFPQHTDGYRMYVPDMVTMSHDFYHELLEA